MPGVKPFDHPGTRRGFFGPAWRWDVAQTPIDSRAMRRLPWADESVRNAHDYLRCCRRGPDGRQDAARRHPLIAAAETLNGDRQSCEWLKILVLAGCERAEIASKLEIDEAVLQVWERLFFDVEPARESIGWVSAHVIRREQNAGNGSLAAKLKLACAGGPVAARAILEAESRIPLSEGERLFHRRLKLDLKFGEAVEMPLSSNREKLTFVKLSATMMLAEKRLELAERRLQARCTEALRKHERAELRRQASIERAQQRAAERQRAADRRENARREKQRLLEEFRLWQHGRRLAEREAALARAAASPLAQLLWNSAADAKTENGERQSTGIPASSREFDATDVRSRDEAVSAPAGGEPPGGTEHDLNTDPASVNTPFARVA